MTKENAIEYLELVLEDLHDQDDKLFRAIVVLLEEVKK